MLLPLLVALHSVPTAERVTVAALCDDAPASRAVADLTAQRLEQRDWLVTRAPNPKSEWQFLCRLDYGRASEQLESGKQAFHKLRFKAAHKRLHRAYRAFSSTGWNDAPPQARDVLVYLGWLALEDRNHERAQELFTEALRLWPAWRPSSDEYPPHVMHAFAEAVLTAAALPRGGLAVRTAPPGASVILNGHTELTSPCTYSDLIPGEHTVALRHPDFGTISRAVVVETDQVLELDVRLSDEQRDDWWSAVRGREWPAVRALAGAELVVVVAPVLADPAKLAGVVIRPEGAQVLELNPGNAASAAEALSGALVVPETAVDVPPPPPPPPPRERDGGVLASWWFWTAVAVVGAGAIAGTTYAVTRPDEMTITVRR